MENNTILKGSQNFPPEHVNYSLGIGENSSRYDSVNRIGNHSLDPYPELSFDVRIAVTVFLTLAQLLGGSGNALVIVSILRERRLHNNYYLLSGVTDYGQG